MEKCATIIGTIASVIAAIGVIYTFVENIINKRKANPVMSVLSMQGGTQYAKVQNYGKADAKKIRITFPNNPNIKIDSDTLYNMTLNPQQQFNISFACGKSRTVEYIIEWEDKHCKHNKKALTTQALQVF